MQAASPEPGVELRRLPRCTQDAPHLGRQQDLVALLPVEEAADAVLALPAAVPRRGVVEAHARVPRRRQGRLGVGLADLGEELAERRSAEADLRNQDAAATEVAAGEWIHAHRSSRALPCRYAAIVSSARCARRDLAQAAALASRCLYTAAS